MATQPEQEEGNGKTNEVYFTVAAGEGLLYSDQTGRLSIASNRDNKYLAIFCAYNPNAIRHGHLLGCPVSTKEKVQRHIKVKDATEMGHLLLVKKCLHSTKQQASAQEAELQLQADAEMATLPQQEEHNEKN